MNQTTITDISPMKTIEPEHPQMQNTFINYHTLQSTGVLT